MSERVFWQRYFRSRQRRETANARDAGAPAAADAGDEPFDCASGAREERLLYPDAAHLAGEEVAAVSHRGSYGLHVDGARGDSAARKVISQSVPNPRTGHRLTRTRPWQR